MDLPHVKQHTGDENSVIHQKRVRTMMNLVRGMLLLIIGGCSNGSEPSMGGGSTVVVPPPGAISAAVIDQTVVLEIVGVRGGIPMTVNPDNGSVSATVLNVPVGTYTFRITYSGGKPSVRILEASG